MEDFNRLKMYFERKEIVVAWFKENSWLHTLLGDFVMRPLRPACLSSDLSSSHFSSDCVSGLVQRFLETGYRSDFNKIRMKLSEMATLQLQNLVRKSRQLRDSIQQDVMKDDCVYVSDYEERNLMNFFGRDPFSEYGRRRIEVVTLD